MIQMQIFVKFQWMARTLGMGILNDFFAIKIFAFFYFQSDHMPCVKLAVFCNCCDYQ